MTTIWDLPEDMLVEEIFSRVPLNYIKSVRSTCKKWNTLLRSRIIGKAEAKKQFTGFMMMNHKVCFIEFHLQNAFIYYCNHPCIKQVSILDQINVSEVIYSDGLLLCITKYELLVWNPYLGQTRWIQPRTKFVGFEKCFLGYDKNLNHKILRFCFLYHQAISSPITGFEIYDFSSDSWNVLDVTPPPDWEITPNSCVSLKGNTYFCARRREVSAAGRIINVEPNFLVCFDFTTESFGPRLPLPFDSGNYAFVSLSCVREEQLAVLYQFRMTHEKIDIFVTNKISPSVVSWIKFIVGITGILLHLGDGSFFIDEETKLAVVFGRDMITRSQTAHTIETSGYSKSVLIGNASAHRPLCDLTSQITDCEPMLLHTSNRKSEPQRKKDIGLMHLIKPIKGREAHSFFIDEDTKRAVLFSVDWHDSLKTEEEYYNAAYIIGKNDFFKSVDLGATNPLNDYVPAVCPNSYVPSLVQIKQNCMERQEEEAGQEARSCEKENRELELPFLQ
ncbi:unnamed protein product [Brassica napus]|uniref:(rape) hypothetical protein n=1 Tax=Brassica napus TaxID=3708 RepID=A0A816JFA9_BRANA|nr:unnamed protein product [Brassica napus]